MLVLVAGIGVITVQLLASNGYVTVDYDKMEANIYPNSNED